MSAPMTDRERLLDLLNSFGITPVTSDSPAGYSTDPEAEGDAVLIVAHQGGVEGYTRFFCEFGFNDDGSFKDVGVWE